MVQGSFLCIRGKHLQGNLSREYDAFPSVSSPNTLGNGTCIVPRVFNLRKTHQPMSQAIQKDKPHRIQLLANPKPGMLLKSQMHLYLPHWPALILQDKIHTIVLQPCSSPLEAQQLSYKPRKHCPLTQEKKNFPTPQSDSRTC